MAEVPGAKKAPLPAAAPPRKTPAAGLDVINEAAELSRFNSLKKRIKVQAWIMAGLVLVLLVILPITQPAYVYYARKPNDATKQMMGLDMSTMTNRAILSWTTTAITEIMTMGFGDIDKKVPQQKKYFTSAGWRVYTDAFAKTEVGKTFKSSQLVLTTVPSNTPVILDQGINPDQDYQWTVQMPVIMTYATNNNKTVEKSSIVTVTIVRVPADDNPFGIAIKQWSMK